MAVQKIEFDGHMLIDLTADTVNQAGLLNPLTAHDANGAIITGSMPTVSVATPTVNITTNTGIGGNQIDAATITPVINQPYGFCNGGENSGTQHTIAVRYGTTDSSSVSSNSITFTGLPAEPFGGYFEMTSAYTTTTTRTIMQASMLNQEVSFIAVYHSGNGSHITGQSVMTDAAASSCCSYNNGTLTITTPGASTAGQFATAKTYTLHYMYLEVN